LQNAVNDVFIIVHSAPLRRLLINREPQKRGTLFSAIKTSVFLVEFLRFLYNIMIKSFRKRGMTMVT